METLHRPQPESATKRFEQIVRTLHIVTADLVYRPAHHQGQFGKIGFQKAFSGQRAACQANAITKGS